MNVKERLAARTHGSWARWAEWMLDTLRRDLDQAACDHELDEIPELEELPCVARWRRQIQTPYEDLPEGERISDLYEADDILAALIPNNEAAERLVKAFGRYLDWGPADILEAAMAYLYRWSLAHSERAACLLMQNAKERAPW